MAGTLAGFKAGRAARRADPARSAPWSFGGRRDFVDDLEAESRQIRDPVAKLRFIRGSLARYEEADRRLQAVPLSPLRWLLYRLTRLDRLRPLFTTNPNGAAKPPRTRLPQKRRAGTGLGWAMASLAALGAAAAAGFQASRPSLAAPRATQPAPATLPIAESLPVLPVAVSPDRIWQVDGGEGWELYSNGLRVDTTHAVAGEPRSFHVFDARGGMRPELFDKPVGILYHTSESDIWPLEESFNEKLRDSSQSLLRYLRRNHVYNYLIDRFGQVFRVVEEADKANHAGISIWAQDRQVYLNLNASFLGICFETRWDGGRALPITQAQLSAGHSLTDYLRKKWGIAPEMCVTHGLTSVNARKHLIGHHVDWARGFPFEAFGLPNHYRRPTPSVALFGFGYDDRFLAVMGEPWPGVREAERALAEEAVARGRSEQEVRNEKQDLYDRWLAEQTRDQEDATRVTSSGDKMRAPGRNANGG